MRVLVTAASKCGATWEIGEAIGEVLQGRGLETEVARPADVRSAEGSVMALRAPEGDFRDWDAIRSWAGEIADALRS